MNEAEDGKPGRRAWGELLLALGVPTLLLLAAELLAGGGGPAAIALGTAGIVGGVLLVHRALRRSGAGWAGIGFRRPREGWIRTGLRAAGTALLAALLANLVLTYLVLPLTGGEPPDISRFRAIRGDPWLLAAALGYVWSGAAFGEEILYRGFLITRLGRLLGGGGGGRGAAAAVSAALFGAMHFYQGPAGIAATGTIGLVLALAYLRTDGNLWIPVLAHGFIDTTSLLALYLGVG